MAKAPTARDGTPVEHDQSPGVPVDDANFPASQHQGPDPTAAKPGDVVSEPPPRPPGNLKRNEIAARFRRDGSEDLDTSDPRQMLLGMGTDGRITDRETGESLGQKQDEEDVEFLQSLQRGRGFEDEGQPPQPGKPAAKPPQQGEQRTHGNKQIEVLVNGKLQRVAMGELRRMVAEDVGEEDIDSIPEQVVIRSGKILLAAKDRLSRSKERPQEQPQPQELQQRPQPEPQQRLRADPSMVQFVQDLQYGDPTEMADRLESYIADRAMRVATDVATRAVVAGNDYQEARRRHENVQGIVGEIFASPEFQPVASDPTGVGALTFDRFVDIHMGEAIKPFLTDDQFASLDNVDKRGQMFKLLRQQGASIPTERDVLMKAKASTLHRLTGQGSTQQDRRHEPTSANLSEHRQERRLQAAPQPRASSAAPPRVHVPKTYSQTIAEMRAARRGGHPTRR